MTEMNHDYDVLVVGAGFAGLYALYKAERLGYRAIAIEAQDGVGGVWRANRYPGAHCDVESADYSFSFDEELQQEWHWTKRFAPQTEILAYLEHVADRYDLRGNIRFNTRVDEARFDEAAQHWAIRTSDGATLTAQFVVFGGGALSIPLIPNIPGLADFKGEVLYTSSWPVSPPQLAGKRVGVVGTGSSGVQVIPELAKEAGELVVFQRTAAFTVPAQNRVLSDEETEAIKREYPERRRLAKESASGMTWKPIGPSALDVTEEERQRGFKKYWDAGTNIVHSFGDLMVNEEANDTAAEFVRSKISDIVASPEVARALMPSGYPIGAKRLCRDTDYYETFNRENVTLVDLSTDPIIGLEANGLRTENSFVELDVIVLATGFDALTGAALAVDFRGVGGRSLREWWAEGPSAYLGLTVTGFPNLFLVTGPGSPSVLSNMVMSIEQHVEWAFDLIADMKQSGKQTFDPLPAAEQQWMEHTTEVASHTLYAKAASWYMGANIPGKPRVFLPYVGGVGVYRTRCDDEAAAGYPHLRFTSALGAEAPA